MSKIIRMETTLNNSSRFRMSDKAKNIVIDIVAYIFMALFVYTATDKLGEIPVFTKFLSRLDLIGFLGKYLAWAIPITELIIAALLIFPMTRMKGLIASGGLMVIFTIYLIYMKLTAEHLPCHCGGLISLLSWRDHIYLNIIFIFIAGIGIYLSRKKKI